MTLRRSSVFCLIVVAYLSLTTNAFNQPFLKRSRTYHPGLKPGMFGNFFGTKPQTPTSEPAPSPEPEVKPEPEPEPEPAAEVVSEEKSEEDISTGDAVAKSSEETTQDAKDASETAEVTKIVDESETADESVTTDESETGDESVTAESPETAEVSEAVPETTELSDTTEVSEVAEADPVLAVEEAASSEGETKRKPSWKRERYTIFAGNLPFDTTDSQIRDLFAEHGKVELVSVPRNRETGQSRGFAFVDMGSPEELDAAVAALDGQLFGSRTLRAAKSLPREEAKKQPKKRDQNIKKLYIGNIPFDATKEDLTNYFGEYGEVFDVYIPIDANSGSPRGFAFLSMKNEEAENVIESTNGMEFMGRKLAVSVPLPPGEKAPKRIRRTKIYVGNLSFYTVAETLRALFEEFGEVHDCYMPEDAVSGGSRGFGFVTMDEDAARAAIDETDGCELDGRFIRVNEAQPKRFNKDVEDEGEDASYTEA